MKKTLLILTALLSGCTLLDGSNSSPEPIAQLQAPKTLQHHNKSYTQKANHDLGTIARLVYFSGKESEQDWKTEIEILHDRNKENRSLKDRAELRERVYNNSGVKHFNLYIKNNGLYSFVIYSPTTTMKNWQVNISRGENIEGCGFVQYQYSLKLDHSQKLKNMGKIKLISHLRKQVIDKEMAYLEKIQWNWQCQSTPQNHLDKKI